MNTNGRSNAFCFITTSDERRRHTWQHIFGTDELPVIGAAPRWQVVQGRAFDVLAYDLALSQLTAAQRARFAGYLSRKYRLDYAQTLAELNGRISYPIKASFDIQVVEPAEQTPSLASLFGGVASRLLRQRASLWWRLARA